MAPPITQQVTGSVASAGCGEGASPASPLTATSVELLDISIAWQAASRPTLRRVLPAVLDVYTVVKANRNSRANGKAARRAFTDPGPLRAGRALALRRRLDARGAGADAAQDDGDRGTRALDHRAQRFARHSVRPVGESLSRLRARLHLLLRATDPRLSRALAGPRFRDQALCQDQRGRAAEGRALAPRLSRLPARFRRQYGLLPADRTPLRHHARTDRGARRVRPSAHHRHQVSADRARHRPAGADGPQEPDQGFHLGHDPGCAARA